MPFEERGLGWWCWSFFSLFQSSLTDLPRTGIYEVQHRSKGTLPAPLLGEVTESSAGSFSASLPHIILAGISSLHIPPRLWQRALSSIADQTEIPAPARVSCLGSPCSEGGCALRVEASPHHGLCSRRDL